MNNFHNNVNNLARALAIDFGKIRSGIAVTDEMKIIASGLTTVATPKLMDFLKEYLATEDVDVIVVGKPLQMDNSASESEALIVPFVKALQQTFPSLMIERVDERFTSKMAMQSLIDSGMKKKHRSNKALIDEISATIILQTYLNSAHQ